jgi:type IV secretory pathway TraG/TraD family ATPase VirD4
MESLVFSLITFLFQLYMRCLGIFIKIVWQLSSYILHEGFKLIGQQALSKKILILGPGESLKPTQTFREMFDYSQTAHREEVEDFANSALEPGFWLGRQVLFHHSSVSRSQQDVWLPADFIHQHMLIVGPTGSGKTELLMKSAGQLMSKGNLVCVDAAGFLGNRLNSIAKTCGSRILCWDIGNVSNRVVWNFLEELEKFGSIKDIRAIASALYGKDTDNDTNQAFWERDRMWLTAILGVVVESRRQKLLSVPLEPSDLPSLLMNRDWVRALLVYLPEAKAQWGADLASYLSLADDQAVSFLYKKLSPFKDPDVRSICDGKSQIFLLPAFNGKTRHTLVIGQSLADGEFGASLASVMLSYVMNVMYRRMRQPNHSWTPTYFICDEAPRLKSIDYEEITAIGRNARVGVVLMCQSIDQFPDRSRPALNNCRTQIFLQNVSYESAKWMNEQLGEYSRQIVTMSGKGIMGPSLGNQKSIGYERVPILGIREISDRPYKLLPSKRSALVRITSANSSLTKPFVTDYST